MLKSIKHGFTLAEVLTTLMVIGVVAAMTIPTLMNSTTEQQYKVAYKKAMSVLGQGIQLMTAREEECVVKDSATLADCMNKVISGSIVDKDGKAKTGGSVISTPDGLAYQFLVGPKFKANDTLARSLTDICGDSDMMGSDKDDYSGKNAKCVVIVDLNGTAKGAKSFSTDDAGTLSGEVTDADVAASGETPASSATLAGSEQQAILLTGAGVRPIFVDGNKNIVNKGYQYMYGDKATPFSGS